MRLNHLHLMVSDARGSAEFLETWFGMKPLPGGRDKFVVMHDESWLILTLMQGKGCAYPKHFHIGFTQATRAEVDGIWERMKAAGISPSTPEAAHAWFFYVRAPGGFLIEVLGPLTDEDAAAV